MQPSFQAWSRNPALIPLGQLLCVGQAHAVWYPHPRGQKIDGPAEALAALPVLLPTPDRHTSSKPELITFQPLLLLHDHGPSTLSVAETREYWCLRRLMPCPHPRLVPCTRGLPPTCSCRCGCLPPVAGARRHAACLPVLRAVSTKRGEVLLIADTLGKTHDGEKQLFEVGTGMGAGTGTGSGTGTGTDTSTGTGTDAGTGTGTGMDGPAPESAFILVLKGYRHRHRHGHGSSSEIRAGAQKGTVQHRHRIGHGGTCRRWLAAGGCAP